MPGKRLLTAVTVGLLALVTAAFAGESADEREVRSALEHYLMGHATGDGSHFRLIFHPDSKLTFVRGGAYTTRTAEEYISGASGKPAADEAQRKRRIVSVDVTGDAATGKIELDYPTAYFIDYFTLLKIDGKWMIMNKTFNVRQK